MIVVVRLIILISQSLRTLIKNVVTVGTISGQSIGGMIVVAWLIIPIAQLLHPIVSLGGQSIHVVIVVAQLTTPIWPLHVPIKNATIAITLVHNELFKQRSKVVVVGHFVGMECATVVQERNKVVREAAGVGIVILVAITTDKVAK
jgi:hypothetical protein